MRSIYKAILLLSTTNNKSTAPQGILHLSPCSLSPFTPPPILERSSSAPGRLRGFLLLVGRVAVFSKDALYYDAEMGTDVFAKCPVDGDVLRTVSTSSHAILRRVSSPRTATGQPGSYLERKLVSAPCSCSILLSVTSPLSWSSTEAKVYRLCESKAIYFHVAAPPPLRTILE